MPEPDGSALPEGAAPAFDRRRLTLLLIPVGLFTVLSYAGTILSARLVNDHPLALIALDARLRHLLLSVAAGVDPLPYFIVGLLRLVAADPVFYLLGYWYGDAGLRWMERKAGGVPSYVRWIERWFPRIGPVLVALLPNNLVCLLAGATGMKPRTFVSLNVGGTVLRLAVVWWLGKAFEGPLDEVLDFVQDYQWPLTGAFFVLVLVQSTRQAAKAQLAELRAEAAAEAAAQAAGEASAPAGPDTGPLPHDPQADNH
jgi:membrane protein DedA with SNARE-associated domain